MQRADLSSITVGSLVGVVGYFVAMVVVVPLVAGALLDLPPTLLATAVLLAAAVPSALGGAVTAMRRRPAPGVRASRTGALLAAATTGLVTGVVVAGVGAVAAIGNHARLSVAAVILPLLVLTAAAMGGAALVRPERRSRTGRRPRSRTRRDALVGDTGQATLEGLGIVSVAVLLVAALVLVMTPAGVWVQDRVRAALCELTGGTDCGAAIDLTAETRPEPEHACVLEDHRDARDVVLSVTWVQVEGGDRIRVEELPGDRFRVSSDLSGGVGGQIGVGGGVSVVVDDQGYGAEAQAGVSAVLAAGGGATWVVDGTQQRDQLVDYLKGERDWRSVQGVMAGSGPIGFITSGVATAGREAWRFLTDGYRPDLPTEIYAYGGVEADGSANATGILSNAAAAGSTATVVGARQDIETGATTMYFHGSVEGSATAQQRGLDSMDAGASGRMELMLAVTYDPDGMPVTLQAQQVQVGAYGAEMNPFFGEDFVAGDSGGYLFDARVSLTDGELRDIAYGLMQASGITTPSPVDRAVGGYDALSTFVGAAQERGTLTMQTVTLEDSTSFAIQGGGEVAGIGLGGSFSNSTSTVTSTGAHYWDGSGWRSWGSCSG